MVRRAFAAIGLTLLALSALPASAGAAPGPISIQVDASEPGRRRIPVLMTFPVAPGPFALVLPGWLPGTHSPDAPMGNFGRIRAFALGEEIVWRRDPFNPNVLRMEVPRGAARLEASFDYVPVAPSGAGGASEVGFGVAAGKQLAVLNPAALCLVPEGDPRRMQASLTVRLPQGWSAASALARIPGGDPSTATFAPASIYTLIDSPIMTGQFRKSIPLATPPGDVPHTLELFADTAEILAQKEGAVVPLATRLVAESGRLFGVRHYRSFHYLLALSTEVRRYGLEHHESVAYVLQPNDFDPKRSYSRQDAWNGMLMPHEFVHSWNGKFRRPYGENPAKNTDPQSADLTWVYEGLTQYLGDVLMVRCGYRTVADWRKDLTGIAAGLRFGPGRDWQSVADAALVSPKVYISGTGTSLRSTGDVYFESMLAWLEADATIRRVSGGTRSIEDFCRRFFGGPNRGPEIIPYKLEDVVAALEQTEPGYDWRKFVQQRFYSPPAGLPTAGLEAAGWKLAFGEATEPMGGEAARGTAPEGVRGGPPLADYRHSLGALITSGANGTQLTGVVPNSPLDRAGLGDGATILGVNGFLVTPQRLRDGIRATKGGKNPLDLLIADGEKYRTVRIEGMDGEKSPLLERIPDRPDLLAAIASATVK